MTKRLIHTFIIAMIGFTVIVCRLAVLTTNQEYATAASNQTENLLQLSVGRGNIYDCNFKQLTNTQTQTYALIEPGRGSYHTLFTNVPEDEKAAFYQNIQGGAPFLMSLNSTSLLKDEYVFDTPIRYMQLPIAQHLIGYLGADEKGVSGLEYVYNDLLEGGSTSTQIYYNTTARGGFMIDRDPKIRYTQGEGNGVMLTIDANLQRICEGIAAQSIQRGSIVVMETATGRIRVSVSMPTFDPQNIAQSIQNNDTSLINRSVSAFNVGSVFKPVLAAAAIEKGVDTEEIYECTGSITINGHIYRCAYGRGHGEVNLKTALEESCNCYFIQLGLKLGGETIEQAAKSMGFGESSTIAGQMSTASGTFPTQQELEDIGQLASISFGQGKLTATPVQVAASMNVFANHGKYIEPSFVEGVVNEYTKTVEQSLYTPVQRQVISSETAQQTKEMLIGVVQEGLGKSAAPRNGGAGGKTGTAQTGRYNEEDEEIMDAWFAGFFPADNPEYTVAVLLDGGTYESEDAAEIFAKVSDAIYFYTVE